MPIRSSRLLGVPVRISAVCMLAAADSHAAAPVYFDLGGLILYGALYLLGLLILPVVIAQSRRKAVWSWILVAYVGVPATYVVVGGATQRTRNDRILEETKVGEVSNVQAFAAYCMDRKRVVNTRVASAADTSLLVRIENGFTGIGWQFNASPIHDYAIKNRAICEKTGLGYLEGIYDGRYVPERKGYEREARVYRMCRAERWTTTTESQSRYELVLGESSEKRAVPWGNEGGRWMSRSSVRLIDKRTGATLAEDMMYFLRYDSGDGGCPNGIEQLATLIAEVFPKE